MSIVVGKLVLLATLAAMVGGCAVDPHHLVPLAPGSPVHIRMVYSSQDGAPAPPPPAVKLRLRLIRGAINGSPSAALYEWKGNEQEFTLDLDGLAAVASKHARRLNAEAIEQGFHVTPRSTRLARVGTFNDNATTGELLGWTMLLRDVDDAIMRLVFFDRPCHLQGTSTSAFGFSNYDIVVPWAGFHWLASIDVGNGKREVRRVEGLETVTHLTVVEPTGAAEVPN